MVMNKALKSKSKAPARKAAVTTKKTTKLPVKASSNGHNDSEEAKGNTETTLNVVDENASESIGIAANSAETNVSNGSQQTPNDEAQPNVNDIDSDETPAPETAKTVRSQRKKPANAEIVDTKVEKATLPSSKTKGQQKKAETIEMDTSEEVSEAQPASGNELEASSKSTESKKRKATEVEETEQKAEVEPEAVAGPSTLPSRSRKKKAESASNEPITSKAKSTTEKRAAAAPKTKAKRQKVVLDIPPVRPIAGKVFVIGQNDVGQLGLDDAERTRPAMLELPDNVVDIAAGGMHSVCLTENGEVITFGCNDEGALGRITTDDSLEFTPLKVEIPEKVVQISAGDSHSAALTESGKVYIWGNFRAADGPMGLTIDQKKRITPIRILNDVTVVKISSGTEHIACLSNGGLIYTLGCGENGQLGRLTRHNCQGGGRRGLDALLIPAPVHVGSKKILIDDVWTGSYNTLIRAQETGSIYAFGLNNYEQLGCDKRNDEDNIIFTPKRIESFSSKTWLCINGGQHHTLALDTEGLVHSLGRETYGRLGLGTDCGDRSVPTVIPTLQSEKCSEISCGNCVSFAVTKEGSVFSWGMGTSCQLGHGNDEDVHLPEVIKGKFLNSWKAIKVSGGGQHTLLLAVPKENPKSDKEK